MKQKIILVLIITACLLMITACSADQSETGETTNPQIPDVLETGSLAITADEQEIAEVSLDKIKSYPSVRRQMMINSSEGSTSHDFRGTLLLNILNDIDEELVTSYATVRAMGSDVYQSVFTMEEVQQENNIYIMYSDGEDSLLTRDGQPQGMRIVSLDDQYGQRFTNYLVEIVLEK
ncbi:MAG: hypothetical protein ACOX05_05990 [Bacillota bacterium]